MRELLQQARRYLFLRDCVRDGLGEIDDRIYVHVDADFAVGKWALDGDDLDKVIDACLQNLEPEETDAIESKLSRSKWVKVSDGLPVVPEGQYWAKFWVADKRGNIHKIRILAAYSTATIEHDFRGYTHYMYRQDDTPAPPEDL